jgi:hypothetical protein
MRSYNELYHEGKTRGEQFGFITIKDLLKDKNKCKYYLIQMIEINNSKLNVKS